MNRHITGVPRTHIWQIWGGNAVCKYISRSILLDPLNCFGFGKENISSSFLIFRVYENEVLFFSFYYLYLKYEHEVL